jgi:hypothetical protein
MLGAVVGTMFARLVVAVVIVHFERPEFDRLGIFTLFTATPRTLAGPSMISRKSTMRLSSK